MPTSHQNGNPVESTGRTPHFPCCVVLRPDLIGSRLLCTAFPNHISPDIQMSSFEGQLLEVCLRCCGLASAMCLRSAVVALLPDYDVRRCL